MKKALFVMAVALAMGGCASMTPTAETEASYAIYDVKPNPGVTAAKLGEAIKTALQKNMKGVQMVSSIPPFPLPEKPSRFQLANPFKGSAMAAFAAGSGHSFERPTCEGSMLTANAQDSMQGYGEGTSFFLCLLPYQGGYHIDIYVSFTKLSGGFSGAVLGATLARTVVGDSSQFIPRTVKAVVDSVQAAGATTTLVEQYP